MYVYCFWTKLELLNIGIIGALAELGFELAQR